MVAVSRFVSVLPSYEEVVGVTATANFLTEHPNKWAVLNFDNKLSSDDFVEEFTKSAYLSMLPVNFEVVVISNVVYARFLSPKKV